MRFVLIFLIAAAALTPSAAAAQSCTQNVIGTFTYTNCSDGSSATTSQIGNSAYTTYSNGTSSTTTRIGNSATTSDSNGQTSTTTQLGPFGYTNGSDGTSATSQRIGQSVYTHYSDGSSAVTNRLGQSTVTNYSDGSGLTVNQIGATPSSTDQPEPPVVQPYGVRAPVLGVLVDLPPGVFIKGSGPAIYVVWNGQRLTIPDWHTYLGLGGATDLHNVLELADGDLSTIPLGPALNPI